MPGALVFLFFLLPNQTLEDFLCGIKKGLVSYVGSRLEKDCVIWTSCKEDGLLYNFISASWDV